LNYQTKFFRCAEAPDKVAAAIEFTSQTDFIALHVGGGGGGGGLRGDREGVRPRRGGLCKLMKWRSSRMKLRYARPGNAQFIAKIFVFNMARRKLQREKYTRRDVYISNMCFAFNCLARIDRVIERTIRLRKMRSAVGI